MAYELSRHEHIQHKVHIAAALADLEFELTRIEAKLGGPKIDGGPLEPHAVRRGGERRRRRRRQRRRRADRRAPRERARYPATPARALPRRTSCRGPCSAPCRSARLVPQDLHTAGDVAIGLGALAVACFKLDRPRLRCRRRDRPRRSAPRSSDHRLSARSSPRAEHHAIDCAPGAAPRSPRPSLGYAREGSLRGGGARRPRRQALAGAALTDYRAATGLGHEADEDADPQYATKA